MNYWILSSLISAVAKKWKKLLCLCEYRILLFVQRYTINPKIKTLVSKGYSQFKCCAYTLMSGWLWGLLRQACPLPLVTLFTLQRTTRVYPGYRSVLIANSSQVWHLSSSLLTWQPKIEGVTWWKCLFCAHAVFPSAFIAFCYLHRSCSSPQAALALLRINSICKETRSSRLPTAPNAAFGAGRMNDVRAFRSAGFIRGLCW